MSVLRNSMTNRKIIKQTEATFLDFKKKTFHEDAKYLYDDVYSAYYRKDKVELMKFLSAPLYEVIITSLIRINN